MGCGTSNNQSRTVIRDPVPVVPSSPKKQKTEVALDTQIQWEDDRIMYDADLEREMKNTRIDSEGNEIHPYLRLESRPEDNPSMARVLQGPLSISPDVWFGPSEVTERHISPPAGHLELEYIHGYRCLDSRMNLYYGNSPESIVYASGAVGVVLNVQKNTQNFFGGGLVDTAVGHSDDILALAVSPNRTVVATGEAGNNPKICIWSPASPEAGPTLEIRQGQNTVSVEVLAFSLDGRLLAACDGQSSHVLRVFDTSRGVRLYQDATDAMKILHLSWGPDGLATVGIKHLLFWTGSGKSYRKETGNFGEAGKMCTFTTVGWKEKICITGATNGQIYIWENRILQKVVQVLPLGASIHALSVNSAYLLTGGNDNIVHELDVSTMHETRSFPVPSFPKAIDSAGNKVLCGLRDGTIMEFEGQEERVLMQSHSDGDVTGLACHPKQTHLFVSAGDDNKVKLWDAQMRRCLATGILDPKVKSRTTASSFSQLPASQQSRSVAISKNGTVAIGHNDGHLSIRAGINQLNNIQKTLTDSSDWVEALAYSPDGSKLFAGSHDKEICVYDTRSSYRLMYALVGHKSAVIAADWNVAGTIIRSVSSDGEVLYWDTESGKHIQDGEERCRDEAWTTWTGKFGWPVVGVSGVFPDLGHVNGVDRSPDGKLLALGNEYGLVEIYRHPSAPGARSHAYKAHSHRVTNVRWSSDGRRLFSTGGYDQCTAQWRWVDG